MRIRPAHCIDFYKADHRRQHPANTSMIYSNMTPRSTKYASQIKGSDGKIVVAGLQSLIQESLIDLWNDNFFSYPKEEVLREYKELMDTSLGEDVVPIEHIGELHDLGYLPLTIKTLPEGARINEKIPFMTWKTTIAKFAYIGQYVETLISAEAWKLITVATIAFEYRKLGHRFALLTGVDPSSVLFQFHDFSFRGMSGVHDAARSGIGHLLSFTGSDCCPAIDYARDYYGAKGFVAGSIPATEHAVMCMGTKKGELATYRRLITEIYPTGLVGIVSDTWDFWNVITNFTRILHDEIVNRKPNSLGMAKVVFRPDSGDPADVICGDLNAPSSTPQHLGALQCLWYEFGGTINDKGFKVLNERVGLIYGDSITLERAEDILERMMAMGFASSNIVFGVGSYTYQMVSRDTYGQAVKATWGVVDSEPREIFKDPVTDDGVKKSAKGLLRVELMGNNYMLFDQQDILQEDLGELKTRFHNSVWIGPKQTLGEIREALTAQL